MISFVLMCSLKSNFTKFFDQYQLIFNILKQLQSNQVKRTPQDAINEFIIQKLNPLVVVNFRFISEFLHS